MRDERDGGNLKHAALDAWRRLGHGRYEERLNKLGEDLASFYIKIPTGGGKTLVATQALGAIYRTILRERNGAGLAVWVVPSSQIYRDTVRRLSDRRDMYRIMLEHAASRRVEVWEKKNIYRLSPARLRDCLNILVVQLAATNRETKEQLRFFKDAGGNIVRHFPPERDGGAHRRLWEEMPNLDMIENDAERGRHLVKTSIGNLVRLCRPPVILDEGHKAMSRLAQDTIEEFNASIVVQLSATPPRGANVLCRVSGGELLEEEMIKLPLNIATSGQKSWQNALTKARDKRDALAKRAADLLTSGEIDESRLIRPIVLVQVERTGKDQQGSGYIHSEHVKEYLVQRLGVAATAIAIKTSSKDDIEGIDLMDPGCPIEWIITKAALQEGWDCPFAYILVSLNATRSKTALTQLVGRILRQPHQQRVGDHQLNESYVYCLHAGAQEIARQVKKALEKEGYEGEKEGLVVDASGGDGTTERRQVRIRERFRTLYAGRPFEGKIYLPRFCVKEGREYAALCYHEHLISRVDVDAFHFERIDWPMAEELRRAKDRFYRMTLNEDISREYEAEADLLERDEQVIAWMAASVRFDYLSHKQLRRTVHRVCERVVGQELDLRGRLALVKFPLRDRIERWILGEVDRQTEAAFGELFDAGRIRFYLECAECRFQVPESISIRSTRPLTHENGAGIARSLFDYVEYESQNSYERAVALCIDKHADVLWWLRNKVGPENFTIQGYRRNRIFPDFVVQSGKNEKPVHQVIVVESKGAHLEGHPDTTYKRSVARFFEKAGRKVSWRKLGEDFQDHVFRFQILDQAQEYGRTWEDELVELLRVHGATYDA
jgi:type III restriction enzyme